MSGSSARRASPLPLGVALVACALGGCGSFVTPAAADDFFATPFRAPPPPAEPSPARPRLARSPALAAARYHLPNDKMAAEKVPPGAPRYTPGLQPASLVEGTLRQRGVRFGTDGNVASLYTYVRLEQGFVAPSAARTGDVLFFQLDAPTCGDHAGVVESVDSGGRITFREVRGGSVRVSYVHPDDRSTRRGSDGRILNTFLRPRRTDDPPEARYFAGEMLCAVGRVRR